ncbi:hypothetical protein [Pseudanabaena sp. PCC 6802]|uniref:hypothetical protein n=1 Tax=Pseudanabaena sp. PCC 6802 TaxID=118173 RepID=UPI00034C586A|nr:hypothetical protein [Pseudanabaena sp. PCC 6802]
MSGFTGRSLKSLNQLFLRRSLLNVIGIDAKRSKVGSKFFFLLAFTIGNLIRS